MTLRDVRHGNALTFPPPWVGPSSRFPRPLDGTLVGVDWLDGEESVRLTNEWEGTLYTGVLLCSDPTRVMPKVYAALKDAIGRPIAELGDIDIPD